jgi:MCM OB domain
MVNETGLVIFPHPRLLSSCVELLARFLAEHSILVSTAAATDNDDEMMIPVAEDDDDDDSDHDAPSRPQKVVRRVSCYLPLLQRIKNRDYSGEVAANGSKTFMIQVPLDEVVAWNSGSDLAQRIAANTVRYISLFQQVVDEALNQLSVTQHDDDNDVDAPFRDPLDILQDQRLAMEQVNREQAAAAATGEDGGVNIYAGAGNPQGDDTTQNTSDASEQIPPELLRRYELRILPLGRRGTHAPFHEQFIPHKTTTKTTADNDALSLRQVKSEAIGRLVTVLGLIVRCSDVKPSCTVAVYSCDACGAEIYQPIPYRREFMPARACTSPHCPSRGGTGRRRGRAAAAPPTTTLPPVGTLHLQTRGSKFQKFQELKIQELPSQVPMGHVPRSMSVYCRGELTRQVHPGDMVTIDGIFLPQKLAESGYKALKAGLISTTYLEAQHVLVHKKSLDESVLPTLSEREQVQLHADIDARNFWSRGYQARTVVAIGGRRDASIARWDAHSRRYQCLSHGRPRRGQVPVAQARGQHGTPRRLYHGQGQLRRGLDGRRDQGHDHGRNGAGRRRTSPGVRISMCSAPVRLVLTHFSCSLVIEAFAVLMNSTRWTKVIALQSMR